VQYFDANVFLGSEASPTLRTFEDADALLREMDELGVERAAVSHFLAQQQFERGNAALTAALAGRERLAPCWIVTPHALSRPGAAEAFVSRLVDQGVRMLRLQPGAVHGYSLHPWALAELLDCLTANRIVLYVDFVMAHGYGHPRVPPSDWETLYACAQAHPALNIILFAPKLSTARMQVLGLLKACPNVHLDTASMQLWLATELICETVGPERLVFGSHMPYFDPTQFMVQIAYAQIPAEAKAKIASGNLRRLLGEDAA